MDFYCDRGYNLHPRPTISRCSARGERTVRNKGSKRRASGGGSRGYYPGHFRNARDHSKCEPSPSRHQYFHVLRCMSLGYANSKHPTPENHRNPAKKEPYRDHFHLEKTISGSTSAWWTASLLLLLEVSTGREFQMKAKARVVQQRVGLKQSCRNLSLSIEYPPPLPRHGVRKRP